MGLAVSELPRFDPSPLKILVVSDNAFERRVVQDLLIALGVKSIFTAEDGVAAFAQMMIKKPDMIIADAEMRPFSGFMLVREIRASPTAHRNLPIVLFTAEKSPDFAEIAHAAGAQEVLPKPVSADALRRTLEEALLRPRETGSSLRPNRRPAAPQTHAVAADLDRAARTAILLAVDEARGHAARWAASGTPVMLGAAHDAVARAIATAGASADPALTQSLEGALRLIGVARAGHADPRILDVTLSAVRAVLSAPKARNAMRQALAEAVSEAAETRENEVH